MKSINNFIASESKKFAQILKKSGLTGKEFGESLGISEAQVSNIIRGVRKPSREVLARLCEKYGVNLNEFIVGKSIFSETTDTAYIELIRQEAAAGRGVEAEDYVERQRIAVPLSVIAPHREDSVKAVIVKGDSMTGAQISEGDYVLYNTQEMEGESIFVLSVGNTLLVKRLSFDPLKHTLTLLSANPAYPPRLIEGGDLEAVRIAGKVIAVIHRI
jgi:SOS-response transcriptional repressor LexA